MCVLYILLSSSFLSAPFHGVNEFTMVCNHHHCLFPKSLHHRKQKLSNWEARSPHGRDTLNRGVMKMHGPHPGLNPLTEACHLNLKANATLTVPTCNGLNGPVQLPLAPKFHMWMVMMTEGGFCER